MIGKIHSIESMGLADGPGIRTVIFMQGCGLRCVYCHNPDTWNLNADIEMTPETVLKKVLRYKPYYQQSSGGVTCSGGEPLLQPEFLIRFFTLCKEQGIHTVLDTAGVGVGKFEEILEVTDLVLLDVKHVHEVGFRNIAGSGFSSYQKFKAALKQAQTPTWIRQVVIPGITDSVEYLENLQRFITHFPNVEKVELLPYHVMGIAKYKAMNIPYPLGQLPPMDLKRTARMQSWLMKRIQNSG